MLSITADPIRRARSVEDSRGDRESRFDKLIAIHSDYLRCHAYWLCRDHTLADDIVQETLLRAWRFLDTLRDDKATKGWLKTILRREHARLYERKRLQIDAETSLDTLQGDDGDLGAVLDLQAELAHLPEKYREPLLLQVIGGYSCDEIGSRLGLRRGAVMTRVFRARRQMRTLLSGKGSTKTA